MKRWALFAGLLVAACQTPPPQRTGRISTDIFEDIPVPRDAAYRDRKKESFAYRSQTFRCGRFLYAHKGSESDAVRFFKETMTAPPYSWTLTSEDRAAAGSTTLVFVKNEDRCSIDVDRVDTRGTADTSTTTILVRVNYRR